MCVRVGRGQARLMLWQCGGRCTWTLLAASARRLAVTLAGTKHCSTYRDVVPRSRERCGTKLRVGTRRLSLSVVPV